jgi:hypothetical protein
MSTKSAKQLLNEMNELQSALRQVCPHCQHDTLRFITDTSAHCINKECGAFMVTLPIEQFMTLTSEQLESYQRGQTNSRNLDNEQIEFEKRTAEIAAAAAKRQAARDAGVKVYG